MITLQDCIAICDMDQAEVLAIAEHEHIPEIAAVALAQYLLTREHGALGTCCGTTSAARSTGAIARMPAHSSWRYAISSLATPRP